MKVKRKSNRYFYKVVLIDHQNNEFISLFATNSYSLKYKLNETTLSIPSTLGIMCFSNLKFATNFIFRVGLDLNDIKILRVVPIDEYNKVDCICSDVTSFSLWSFYNNRNSTRYIYKYPPEGTICCKGIIPISIVSLSKLKKYLVDFKFS